MRPVRFLQQAAKLPARPSFAASEADEESSRRGAVPMSARIHRILNVEWRTGLERWWPVLDPRTSKLVRRWNVVSAIALLCTATVTPYEVSFLPPNDLSMFVLNRLIDVVFLLDMLLQLFVAFPAPHSDQHWVTHPAKILHNYLTGWFWLDLVSVGVSGFDAFAHPGAPAPADGLSAGDSEWQRLEILRGVRALRLSKMLRLLKAQRNHLLMAARGRQQSTWATRYAINYDLLQLGQVGLMLLLVAHWFACAWGLQAAFEPRPDEAWVAEFGFCAVVPPGASGGGGAAGGTAGGSAVGVNGSATLSCRAPFALYAASLYWSVMTITSIGYGDVRAHAGQEHSIAPAQAHRPSGVGVGHRPSPATRRRPPPARRPRPAARLSLPVTLRCVWRRSLRQVGTLQSRWCAPS